MTQPRNTPNPATSTRPSGSSTKVARKAPLGFLPWLLLGLLLLILLGVLIALLAARDDDGGSDTVSTGAIAGSAPTAPAVPAAEAVPTGEALPTGSTASSAPVSTALPSTPVAAGGSRLTVADSDLLSLARGSLTDQVGGPVTGTAPVQSVVSDEGFWVGPGQTQRVFVHLSTEARRSQGESPFRVTAGQQVMITGTLTANSSDSQATAGVTDAEGLALLRQQGAFVQAMTIALSS